MTNAEAAQTRDLARQEADRARQESSERASTERNKSAKDRYKENLQKNEERKQERNAATNALTSGSANIRLSEIARIGGPVGRKLEREIRNFQQTGRVSNWLAGETLKAEAAQNAAQQSAFRQAVTDVISTSSMAPIQIGQTNSYIPPLSKKPEIPSEAVGGTVTTRQPWDLYVVESNENSSTVRVQAGTLTGFLPTNWDIEETLPINGTLYYAKAIVNNDGNAITSVSINIDSQPPVDQEPQEYGISNPVEYLFGLFLDGSVYRVIGDGHINISPKLWLTTEKPNPPSAGELPFIQFFALR